MRASEQEPGPKEVSSADPAATPSGGLSELLLPKRPREFPGQRYIKICLRALHVLCAGTLVGAFTFAVEGSARQNWFLATLLSGAALLSFDLIETSAFLLQLRGLIILVKIGLLLALPAFGAHGYAVLMSLLLLSVITSHAPSKLRYFMLVGRGRIQGSQSKG